MLQTEDEGWVTLTLCQGRQDQDHIFPKDKEVELVLDL